MAKGVRSHRRAQREKRVLRQTTMKAGSTCPPPAAASSLGGVQAPRVPQPRGRAQGRVSF